MAKGDGLMNTYNIKVTVEYEYEVEAETYEDAEKQGWEYEEYNYTGSVYDIEVDLVEEDIYGEEESA